MQAPDTTRRVTFDAFNDAWRVLQSDWGTWALCGLLYMVIGGAVTIPFSLPGQVIGAEAQRSGNPMLMFGNPIYWLCIILQSAAGCLAYPFQVTIARMGLRKFRGEPIEVGMIFQFEGMYIRLAVFGLVFILCSTIATCFCIVPAFLVYALFGCAGLLIMERKLDLKEALDLSMKTAMPSMWIIVGVQIVGGFAAAAGIIACVIGIIATLPLAFLTQAMIYNQLFGADQAGWVVTPADPNAAPYYRPGDPQPAPPPATAPPVHDPERAAAEAELDTPAVPEVEPSAPPEAEEPQPPPAES